MDNDEDDDLYECNKFLNIYNYYHIIKNNNERAMSKRSVQVDD